MALEYPEELKYLDSHEYLRVEGDTVVVGVTSYAVDQLGDIVFVSLPEEGDRINRGDSFGSIESVKAVEELYAPLSGTVLSVNTVAVEDPALIGSDPYGDGWLIKVRLADPGDELSETMSAEEYRERVEG
ncbi:MAG: glycine cleavage system protein GcvH [Aphanocapsa lilacina HA4352-LM1]|jgi:glycine cleavage system H protein|uniref:Glycine cleavage system H protein n=1 Tax=Gloeobacter morelensis MG652769 TaxID=2781736 RepID=A0ABY3PQV0_9CYAN|nr:glycine cleavage system protein GcvH [Gloeobacter morelensis]MBW4696794.1 glycine cleavage system protein GcvH [Aphanocapsa lilacina HA4352-LM1]UFP96061.1 glycine cleavage system protein GcvH [Gloeobacter morelensis MG652769]